MRLGRFHYEPEQHRPLFHARVDLPGCPLPCRSPGLTVDVCCPLAVLFQKLPLTECPLYLRLLAGPDTDLLSFVLKENETGEVEVRRGSFPRFVRERGALRGGEVRAEAARVEAVPRKQGCSRRWGRVCLLKYSVTPVIP